MARPIHRRCISVPIDREFEVAALHLRNPMVTVRVRALRRT